MRGSGVQIPSTAPSLSISFRGIETKRLFPSSQHTTLTFVTAGVTAMKALEPHLYSRNGHLYYRSAIPRNLHGLFPKEITISLRVSDRREARVIAAQLNQAEQQILETLRQQLSASSPDTPTEGIIQAAAESLESLKGRLPHKSPSKFQATPESKNRAQRACAPFSLVAQKYLAECLTDVAKTRQQKQATFDLFVDLQGDKEFSEIGTAEAQAFKAAMLKMPAHAKKRIKLESLRNVTSHFYRQIKKSRR